MTCCFQAQLSWSSYFTLLYQAGGFALLSRSGFLKSTAGTLALSGSLAVPRAGTIALANTPVNAALTRNITGTYFNSMWSTTWNQWQAAAANIHVSTFGVYEPEPIYACAEMCATLMGAYPYANAGPPGYPYTPQIASAMQALADLWNTHYPAGSLAEREITANGRIRRGPYPPNNNLIHRPNSALYAPLSNATTIATAAAVIGGAAGIIAGLVIAAPLDLAAGLGLVVVGAGTYIYASLNPSMQPSDLAVAMANTAWPSGMAGQGANLAMQIKGMSVIKGLGPYGTIAGGIIGAIAYYTEKYYPQIMVINKRQSYDQLANPILSSWFLPPSYNQWGSYPGCQGFATSDCPY